MPAWAAWLLRAGERVRDQVRDRLRGRTGRAGHARATPPPPWTGAVATFLDDAAAADAEMDRELAEVTSFTEGSAVDILERVRRLDGAAQTLVGYLARTAEQGEHMQVELDASTALIGEISGFIGRLPAQMRAEREQTQALLQHVIGLDTALEQVTRIGREIHLLSINAAIEAARAGESGRGFAVIAAAVRQLSSDSDSVVRTIGQEIGRVRQAVSTGFGQARAAQDRQQLAEAETLVQSVGRLRDVNEDMRHFYRTEIRIVSQHNQALSDEIVELLGSIQYQDIVRQKIERFCAASTQMQALSREAAAGLRQAQPAAPEAGAHAQLLADYRDGESAHVTAAEAARGGRVGACAGAPAIELF